MAEVDRIRILASERTLQTSLEAIIREYEVRMNVVTEIKVMHRTKEEKPGDIFVSVISRRKE